MLKVSRLPSGEPEIFTSIQGEGITAGRPSVFVRLALCNLACAWCDTKYTWDWAAYDLKTSIVSLDVAEVARRVGAQAGCTKGVGSVSEPRVRNVVLTGGEPLLQQGDLAPLAGQLTREGLRIEVETNGTLVPSDALGAHVAQWNVSPKLGNSGNPLAQREASDALGWFATTPEAYFKFVVVGPEDLDEVTTLVSRYRVPRDRVLLMPEGTRREVLQQRSRWLVERCTELGYSFSPRLHIWLWGDQRAR